MVAVLVDEYRPAPRRSLLSAVDEYVAGPRSEQARAEQTRSIQTDAESPLAAAISSAPLATQPVQPRPRTVRPIRPTARQRTATPTPTPGATAAQARATSSAPAASPTVEVRADWSVARTLAAPTPRRSLAPTHVLSVPQRSASTASSARTAVAVSATRATRPVNASVYLWRRIAVAALAVLALAAGWGLFSALGGASLVASERRSTTVTYTVRSGDSLWSVARHVAPSEDPRRVVADLERTRGGAPLLPGETVIWTR